MIQEQEKTEFKVEVVQIGKCEKHPNADTLSITDVGGYPVIFKTGEFREGNLAVYVPVDAVVPTTGASPFAFLASGGKATSRIKARRLRGVFSMGLLIPTEALPQSNFARQPGDDVAEYLGVVKYQSPADLRALKHETGRKIAVDRRLARVKLPVYGLDPLRKYAGIFNDGEEVVITEKIHGCNARYVFSKGRLYVGSHRSMRGYSRTKLGDWFYRARRALHLGGDPRVPAGDIWWEVADKYELKERLREYPDVVLYGEIYGEGVQDLTYDAPKERKFRAFDAYDMKTGKFLDFTRLSRFIFDIGFDGSVVVPIVDWGKWSPEVFEAAKKWANTSKSLLNPNHVAEGVVVKPLVERVDPRMGRVAMKFAGEGYLLRKEEAAA